jgi:hypothetical protein
MAAEREKDPNFQPPKSFVKMILEIKPLFDELRPTVEARLRDVHGKVGIGHNGR